MKSIKENKTKTPQRILKLLERDEDFSLDFKKEVIDSIKIAKTISAFSNCKGGTLLIGVDDEKRITGINAEEEKFIIERASTEFCRPPVSVSYKSWTIGKKSVLEVTVPEGDQKPYYSQHDDKRWMAYLRYDDETVLASKVMVDVLKRRTQKTETLLKYSEAEKKLFDHFNNNPTINVREFTQIAKITSRKAKAIIVNLITLNMITNQWSNGEEYYILSGSNN